MTEQSPTEQPPNEQPTKRTMTTGATDSRGPVSADDTPLPELTDNPRHPGVTVVPGTHKGHSAYPPESPTYCPGNQGPVGAEVLAVPEPADNLWCSVRVGRGTQKGRMSYSPKDNEGCKQWKNTISALETNQKAKTKTPNPPKNNDETKNPPRRNPRRSCRTYTPSTTLGATKVQKLPNRKPAAPSSLPSLGPTSGPALGGALSGSATGPFFVPESPEMATSRHTNCVSEQCTTVGCPINEERFFAPLGPEVSNSHLYDILHRSRYGRRALIVPGCSTNPGHKSTLLSKNPVKAPHRNPITATTVTPISRGFLARACAR